MDRWPSVQLKAAKTVGLAIGVAIRWWVFLGFTVLVLVMIPVQVIVRPAHGVEIWSGLFALWVTVLLIVGLLQLRKNLVIETLVDHRAPGPEEGRVPARALATLLAVELDGLMAAHRRTTSVPVQPGQPGGDRDELRTQVPLGALQPILGTAEIGTFLQSAISPESQVSIGPLKLSLRPLVALVARLAQGRRLAGSIVGDAQTLGVTVQVVQGGAPATWRVERHTTTPGGPEMGLVTDMLRELAAHIFTDLAAPGTKQWRATQSFVAGLTCYRECLPRPHRRALKLRQAANHFRDAIHIDPNFTLARYNLGIVYEAMELSSGMITPETAESVFVEAVALDPSCWFTLYALARHRQVRAEQTGVIDRSVVDLCDRLLGLQPRAPEEARTRTHLIRARAMRSVGTVEATRSACDSARRMSWSWLLRSHAVRRNDAGTVAAATAVAAEVLSLSARVASDAGDPSLAGTLFRRSLALDGGSVKTLYAYARHCCAVGDFTAAEAALTSASGMRPDEAFVLALLALTRARLADQLGCVRACDRLFAHVSRADDEDVGFAWRALRELLRAARQNQEPMVRQAVVPRLAHLRHVRRARHLDAAVPHDRRALQKLLARTVGDESLSARWLRGFTARALGRGLLAEADAKPDTATRRRLERHAATLLTQAHDAFNGVLADESRILDVETSLSNAQRRLGRYREAAEVLAAAQTRDPLDANLSFSRGLLFAQFEDYAAATLEYRKALDANGDDFILLTNAGFAHYLAAVRLVDRSARLDAQRQAVDHLRAALELAPWSSEMLPGLHGALGGVVYQWGQFIDARRHYESVLRIDPDDVGSEWMLGETHLRMGDAAKSRQAFNSVIDKVASRPPTAVVPGWMTMQATRLRARAHIGLAHVLAEADGSLDGAQAHVDAAFAAAGQVTTDDRDELVASILDVAGWVALKRGNVDEALRQLCESVAMDPDHETYWHLANAYRVAAERQQRARARIPLWDKAAAACRHARTLAIADDLAARADKLCAYVERERVRDAEMTRTT